MSQTIVELSHVIAVQAETIKQYDQALKQAQAGKQVLIPACYQQAVEALRKQTGDDCKAVIAAVDAYHAQLKQAAEAAPPAAPATGEAPKPKRTRGPNRPKALPTAAAATA